MASPTSPHGQSESPQSAWPDLASSVVAASLKIAADPSERTHVRESAASLVTFVCSHLAGDQSLAEQMGTEEPIEPLVVGAIERSLDTPSVVRKLARAAVCFPRSRSHAAGEILRLAATAHEIGLLDSEIELFRCALGVDEVEVPRPAARQVVEHAVEHGDKLSVLLLLLRLLERFGPRNEHVRELVRKRPEVQRSRLLCADTALVLLSGEPTAEGWLGVAARLGALSMPPARILKLLRRSRRARLALEKAIERPNHGDLRATLVRWREAAARV